MPAEQARTLPERMDDRMERVFAVIHRLLIVGVAFALVGLSVIALYDAVRLVGDQLVKDNVTQAISVGVDKIFLTVILLELLHTVISRAPLAQQASDFIIIGITSGIRNGLGLVASGIVGNDRELVISLAINSFSVFLLVCALWLVRHQWPPSAEVAGN
jgi:hypothetical protein